MPKKWADVKGLEGFYEVSTSGEIRSIRSGKIIKPGKINGYLQISMSANGKKYSRYVHRVVAEAFIGPIYDQVDHIDGNKSNNKLKNLRLCTRRENQNFHYKSKYPGAVYFKVARKWRAFISINNKTIWLGSYETRKEASDVYKKYIKNEKQKLYPRLGKKP